MQATRFAVEGRNLEAALFYPPQVQPQSPAVFFVHGWTSRKENYARRAEALAELGYIALTFDLSGQGASPGALGDFSRQDHLADVVGAFDFLAAHEAVDQDRIGVCGVSYGAYLAAIATGYRPMPWLAMRVPALYPDEAFTTPTAELIASDRDVFKAHRGQTPQTNMALRAVSDYTGKLLVVRSGEDELIPKATTDAYVAAADSNRLTYEVMEGADHSIFREDWELAFVGILSRWFEAHGHSDS